MLGAISDKIYSMKPTHISDSIAHCARRALRACKQGDAVLCSTACEKNTLIRQLYRENLRFLERKQSDGSGWLIFPIFNRKPSQSKNQNVKKQETTQNNEQSKS